MVLMMQPFAPTQPQLFVANYIFMLNFKKGFTLVELLVVISIIGILSAVVYANFGDARKVSRDEIRKTDLKNLQLAVELYRAQTGAYPAALTNLVPDYIQSLPKDPLDAGDYSYATAASNKAYKIFTTKAEAVLMQSYNDEFARCPRQVGACTGATPPANHYAVYKGAAAEGL